MIIGEAPGAQEIHAGRPLMGNGGKLLKATMREIGMHAAQAYLTHAVACSSPGSKKPSTAMIESCRSGLLEEIAAVNPTKILTLGSPALQALFGQDARISKVRGLGQYVNIPVSYRDVEQVSWKAVWVDPEKMTEKDFTQSAMLNFVDRYVKMGEYKGESVYQDCDQDMSIKQLKTGKRFLMWKKNVTIVQEPDQVRRVFTVATYSPSYILRSPDAFREFALDLQKVHEQDAPLPAPRIDTWITETVEETIEALAVVRRAKVLGCDTETTGLVTYSDHLLSIGFGCLVDDPQWDGLAVIIPKELVYHPDVHAAVQSILDGSEHTGIIAFHNIKFDAQVLHHAGYTLSHPNLSDTMLLSYHWDERPSIPDEQGEAGGGKPQGRSLKTLARVFYDVSDYHFDWSAFYAAMDAGTLTPDDWTRLYTYHGLDCVLTARLYIDMKQRLDEESPKLYPLAQQISVPACLTFAAVEYRGIRIDIPYLHGLREKYIVKMADHLVVVQDAWSQLGNVEPINPGSPVQVMKLLNGHRIFVENTRRDPLLHWKATTSKDDPRRPLIDNLIAYRLTKMMIATYIDGMIRRADNNGRLHPSYYVDGTATGRVACQNPNLQNIPQRFGMDIRHAFIASDGMVYLNADYSQIQVRIAASALFANDPNMRQAYQNKEDVYKVVAAKMYHIPQDQITKMQRQYAKTIVLGTLFEQTSHGIIQGREMALMKDAGEEVWTAEQAEFFQNEFFREFPGFRDYIDRQHAFGREHRYVEDPMGRRRRFPFIAPGMMGHLERQTGNSPIQAGEAEVLLTGINRLHRIFQQNGKAHIVLSVHDSIMSEVRPEHVEEIAAIIKDTLENNQPFFTDIPFTVDTEVGLRWSALVPVDEWIAQQETVHA